MLWNLLKKNINAWQMMGYALASIIGLAIVAIGIKFYCDVRGTLLSPKKEKEAKEFIVVSRPVSILNTFGLNKSLGNGIAREDIEDLKQQPWVKNVGEFRAADFSVTGAVEFEGRSLWTHLFLEAVKDEFQDVVPKNWNFDEEYFKEGKGMDVEIPVIIPKEYLALYNYGYAPSRGLPQISEGMASSIPFVLYLAGNGHSDRFNARIAGFSSRLNTIAVPWNFMSWANVRYGSEGESNPSRLIIEIENPGDSAIEKYLSSNGLEVAGAGLDNKQNLRLLDVVTTIVVSIGSAICALALFILMLSVNLLMQKNARKNSDLLFLGYTPGQVAKIYWLMVCCVNLCVTILAIGLMFWISSLWTGVLSQMEIRAASPLAAVLFAIGIMLLITFTNCVSIRRAVVKTALS